MLDTLRWTLLPEDTARGLIAQLVAAEDTALLAEFDLVGAVADLIPYRSFKLVRLTATYRPEEAWTDTLYALWQENGLLLLLDGESSPVHTANEREDLALTEETVVDYLRFFLFAVRGSDGPFLPIQPPATPDDPPRGIAAEHARPITLTGRDDDGRFLLDLVIAYDGGLFASTIAVAPDGEAEMTDDAPLATDVPADDLPVWPELSWGSMMRTHLSAVRAGIAPAPSAPVATQPPLNALVELLLEQALKDQAGHRLIESFRASLQPTPLLDEFAALIVQAAPVVVVESTLPFVEETIARTLLGRHTPPGSFELVTADVGGDDTEVSIRIRTSGPGLVLVPLHVYRRVTDVERLAFDLASKELSALIACEHVDHLPDSLRRLTDIVLRLPPIDAALFEALFQRVMGYPVPAAWAAGGTEWVKYVQYTDFEHPRRMKLPRDEAFTYVRAQVDDRLGAVNASEAFSLDDLHGLGEARQFAADLIADIHAAIKGEITWDQVDRGALLVGAPGTGKTTLARAIAKDCGVRFIHASATEWQATGQHLGHHIAAIRKTFAEARQYAPTILFIDEIDSIGNRETFSGSNAQYMTEVVNAVLEQIQDVDPGAPVFVIGATNHEDRVDPALRRSGRLDRVIRIPRPNTESLTLIYRHYLDRIARQHPLDASVDAETLGRLSLGLTGADVERIVRGAARRARRAEHPLTQFDVIAELTNKPRTDDGTVRLTPEDIERLAYHEAGHALALFLSSSHGADIGFVTVVPREDGTLGFVAPTADERVSRTRRDYQERIEVYLAGRAAEELRYGAGHISDGATSDLRAASRLAMGMVTRLGLGRPRKLFWSEKPSEDDYAYANDLLVEAYDRILERLRGQQARLDALATALTARQELSGDDVRALLTAEG